MMSEQRLSNSEVLRATKQFSTSFDPDKIFKAKLMWSVIRVEKPVSFLTSHREVTSTAYGGSGLVRGPELAKDGVILMTFQRLGEFLFACVMGYQ